jgi:hypothetical protein
LGQQSLMTTTGSTDRWYEREMNRQLTWQQQIFYKRFYRPPYPNFFEELKN